VSALLSRGADIAGRKMVWAHYVPWHTPDNASQLSDRYYCFPQFEPGSDPFRAEVLRALDMGIDGFFNDMVAQTGGAPVFWDLRPYLKAAEGTPFLFGICLDAKSTADQQAKDLVMMLSTYGDHPNYPKWKGRYVVATYSFFAWTPDEWRAIRKGCADAGYPIGVVANIESGFDNYDDSRLEPYLGTFESAYFFALTGCAWNDTKPLEQEQREAADFCARNGALFMPCLWPGYYGGWLSGRNCFYQPLLGFDMLLRRYGCSRAIDTPWLHITTWNDHDETTLQSRRLATANPALIRAMSREFKGLPPAAKEEIAFAYLRETMAGTVLRIEGIRLPSASAETVSVEGRLLDVDGNAVARLAPRKLSDNWERCEWLVSTTALAASPVLVPEVTITRGKEVRTLQLPAAFLVTGFLKCNDTVKVSERDRRTVDNSFALDWKDGILSGECQFTGDAMLKRAVLYRNERPVTAFDHRKKTVLPVHLGGVNDIALSVEKGRIECAVKSFETNGAPHFAWSDKRIESTMTPGWMHLTARIEADASSVLTLANNDRSRSFGVPELLEEERLAVGESHVRLGPDGTIYDLPTLDRKSGPVFLSVWMPAPEPTDAFWIEFEFADGTFAESSIQYPFATTREAIRMNVVETAITLEHTTGASGTPDTTVFLTEEEKWPVRETKVVEALVSPLAIRNERFDFSGQPMLRPVLPHRRWPMGPFALTCHFTRLADDGESHPVLIREGWNEAPELRLLADGRIEASYGGGSGRGTGEFGYNVQSLEPLEMGREARIELVNDGKRFSLHVDGELQGEAMLPPLRAYGNLTPRLGDGINGSDPQVGTLRDVSFSGRPVP
jgi:hypothetical protein